LISGDVSLNVNVNLKRETFEPERSVEPQGCTVPPRANRGNVFVEHRNFNYNCKGVGVGKGKG
jgi:hypothetical protein